MAQENERLVLAQRPTGMIDDATVRPERGDAPRPGPGQALVRVRFLSMDPTIRGWMDDAPGYLPPIGIGEVIRGFGAGEVVESESDEYPVGTVLAGMTGWQRYVLAGAGAEAMMPVPNLVPLPVAMNVLGVTGLTAYFGLLDVGRVAAGETVVVSGAAGATGSVVGQIARIKGAGTVVGIAGSQEKCAWLVDELGFDAAVDYRTEDVAGRLRELCPSGIDIYWDNVGGPLLDVGLAGLAMRGRVVLCGGISNYNEAEPPPGPRNYMNLIRIRGRMEGFLVLDYLDRFAEAQAELAGWIAEGAIKSREHVVAGLAQAPQALNLLFTGGNVGKVLVEV